MFIKSSHFFLTHMVFFMKDLKVKPVYLTVLDGNELKQDII